MRARVLVAAVLSTGIAAGNVSAQTTTADGVVALARGDYPRAVEILQPLAEDSWAEDTAAQFFMAGLYESGHGVPIDPLKACALYVRAANKYDNPFGQEATKLFGASLSRGQEFNDECQALANLGFDSGFEPATFDLGSGHYVEWTLSATTITYEGHTTRTQLGLMAFRGARFLPLQHTELATGPTRTLPRHFIDIFTWVPSGRSGPWRLHWFVFEVVRDHLVPIDTFDALAERADAPTSREAFDPRDYGILRVDDQGHAERVVLAGPDRGTQRIETDAERREARDEALARDSALEAVDWTKRPGLSRPPTMNYTGADGCGHVQVYGWSSDLAEAIVVGLDGDALGLSTGSATFDLARQSSNVSVQAYVYDRAERQFEFCSDVRISFGPGAVEPQVWRAVAGAITVDLSPPGVRARSPHLRRATVTLSDVVLRNAAGTTIKVTRPVKLSAVVGWFAG